ncbi:MAG: M23 family metallopeptidase [Propionibacteriaceae bacterium]|jgi:murein DD-endopeptidase MepM/ murein hydrolase activator NlpD|nr:M23 family metallopeptidase [Propionibacteriaceae bacterium]
MRKLAIAALAFLLFLHCPTANALSGTPPVSGQPVIFFDPPSERWLAGHRGVDFQSKEGASVKAVASGEITFAGQVGGKYVVTVTHGELRTTYEPVKPSVKKGDTVLIGQEIGKLQSGGHCEGCLHLGLKKGDEYLDPMQLFSSEAVRLLPTGTMEKVKALVKERSGAAIPGLFAMPTDGTFGSPFGMRLHPIFNEWRMHSGQDISAPCGTAIRAALGGTVQSVSYDDASGNLLIIDHGAVGGKRMRTMYLHAQGYIVKAGDKVLQGQVVGKVGATGWSTGCHLHFSVTLNGNHVDPMGYLKG